MLNKNSYLTYDCSPGILSGSNHFVTNTNKIRTAHNSKRKKSLRTLSYFSLHAVHINTTIKALVNIFLLSLKLILNNLK